MNRDSVQFRYSVPFVLGIVPLYLFISLSAVLCAFHHPETSEVTVRHHHHQASGKTDPSRSSSSNASDFCKFAQCLSLVILTPSIGNPVSLQAMRQVLAANPFNLSKANRTLLFLRGPPQVNL